MASHSTVIDALHKQFSSIRSSKSKWTETVVKSGEAFTTVTYNIMREIASLQSDRPEDLWSINIVIQIALLCFSFAHH